MEWIPCPTDSSAPQLRNQTSVLYNNSLWIFGGIRDTQQNNLYSFNLHTSEIKRHSTSGMTPRARESHTANIYNNNMYVIGGWTGQPPYASYDIFMLDLETLEWSEIFPMGEVVPCNMHSAELYGECLYIFRGGDGRNYFSELYVLNMNTLRYQKVHTMGRAPSKRANQASGIVNDMMFVVGGWNGFERLSDMFVYDITSNFWSEVRQSGSVSRFSTGMSLSIINNQLIMFGGSDYNNQFTSDTYAASLDHFSSDNLHISWQVLSIENKPNARFGHTATPISRYSILIYGGRSEFSDENSAYILNLNPMPVFPKPENTHSSIILHKLRTSLKNPIFSDITLIVENTEIRAHKLVLSFMSEVFRGMLEVGMIESNKSTCILTDISYRTFMVLLRYMYTGELVFGINSSRLEATTDEILECLEGADLYMISDLKSECEHLLLDRVTIDNMALLKQFAENYSLENLDKKVSWFITVNNEIT